MFLACRVPCLVKVVNLLCVVTLHGFGVLRDRKSEI